MLSVLGIVLEDHQGFDQVKMEFILNHSNPFDL